MKIATLNISGGFYQGNEDVEYLDRKPSSTIDNKLFEQVVNLINDNALDIVCFQEIITTESFKYIESLKKKTKLKFSESFELSPCNLVKNSMCGLAILSKFKINLVKKDIFPNPLISKTTSSGKTYYTYDKGFLCVDINVNNEKIRILTHHGFPFRRFNAEAKNYKSVFENFDYNIKLLNPNIITGDFNTEDYFDLMNYAPQIYKKTVDEPTTVDGKKFDNILVKKVCNFKIDIEKTLSDHFMILMEQTK